MQPINGNPSKSESTRSGVKRLMRFVKPALILLVFGAVVWRIWSMYADIQTQSEAGVSLSIKPQWGVSAAITYLLGTAFFGLFWHSLLGDAGLSRPLGVALRAYYVGTLGKYIPDKALVVILRGGLINPPAGQRWRTALTVVYETFSMMAVGAVIGLICLFWVEPQRKLWLLIALGTSIALLAFLTPPVFRRIAQTVSIPFGRKNEDVTPALRYHTLARGVVLMLFGWLMLGTSLAGVIFGLGGSIEEASGLARILGTVALATSAGFLVLFMPSGLAVREYIIIELLAPQIGLATAVAASVLLRVIWTLSEILAAVVFYRGPVRGLIANPNEVVTSGMVADNESSKDRTRC